MGFLLDKWTNLVIYVLHWLVLCKYASCVNEITSKASCTGLMVMYADGVEVGRHNNKETFGQFVIPADTQVVGIFCYADIITNKVGGIIAQFDINMTGDYFTDATWKCSETYNSEWMTAYFDDKSWHNAKTLAFNGFPLKLEAEEGAFQPLSGIVDRAQYIWTDKYKLANGNPSVYCRGRIALDLKFDHYGRRFAVAFTENDQSEILIATQKATWVTVYCFTPLLNSGNSFFSAVKRVKVQFPNVIDVPRDLQHEGTITNGKSGIICVSTASVSIVGMSQEAKKTDTFLSFPLEYLGGENDVTVYYALNWDPADNSGDATNGRVLMMAVYDETIIQVFPGDSITFDGKVTKKGDTFAVILKKYASCQFGKNDENHSGTRIVSNKPFIVYCSSQLAKVMPEKSLNLLTEGNLVEQMMPVKYWGHQFILTPLPSGTSFRKKQQLTWYKIIAAEGNTKVIMKFYSDTKLTGTVENTLEAGELYKHAHKHGETAYVTATKGIIVAQFATNTEDDCPGDPWQMMIPPIELYHNYYQVIFTSVFTSSTSGPSCFQTNFVTIIVKSDERDGIIIDEHPIGQLPTGLFTKMGYKFIPGTEYSYMNIHCRENPGLKQHILRHEKPNLNFGVMFFAYGNLDAFATVAGIRIAPVNTKPCIPTLSNVLGDGLDNDCNGDIDNKECSVSEREFFTDCSTPKPVHGKWSSWEPSGACVCDDMNDENGTVEILRSCSDPIPYDKGYDCVGNWSIFMHCKCERKDGGWSIWFPWSQCTGSCLDGASRYGKQIRTRTCSQPYPSNGGKDCTGQNIQTVDCFSYCSQDQTLVFKSTTEFQDCKLDVVILLDRSGRVTLSRWTDLKDFVKSFVQSFTISNEHTKIALVTFGSNITVVFEFGTSIDDMKKLIDQHTIPVSARNTALALSKAHEILSVDRPDADNVVLLLTDGEPAIFLNGTATNGSIGRVLAEAEAISLAEKLRKEKNVTLLAIGFDTAINETFLADLAGKDSDYIHFNKFSDLSKNKDLILQATCDHAATGFSSGFVEQPLNTAAVQGTEAIIRCTARNSIPNTRHNQVWEDFTNAKPINEPSKKPILMATNGKVAPAYQTTVEIIGMYHLNFTNLKTDYAGQYGCRDTFDTAIKKRFAELIVLESDPVLNDQIPDAGFVAAGATVSFSCEVKYRGRWGPVMTWMDSSGSALSHKDMSTVGIAKTIVEFEATREHNYLEITCTTHFVALSPKPEVFEATNVPYYAYITTSEPLIVYYSPENTRIIDTVGNIVEDLLKVKVGAKLICLTESNPRDKVSYEWTTEEGKALGSDRVITVTTEFLEAPVITCTVRNSVGEDNAEMTIPVTSRSVSNGGIVAGASVGTVLGVLLLVGSAFLLVLTRRRKNSMNTGQGSTKRRKKARQNRKSTIYSVGEISNISKSDEYGGFDDW